jgi:phosphohistidine swiveling domain-containing protein
MERKELVPHLRNLTEKLESHFKDMCDVEFTMQEGKLYVLSARIGRRTPQAALRIATDLFLEGKITGKTLLTRIQPEQVSALLKPVIVMNSKLRELGRGVPASPGAATGVAVFSADAALRISKDGTPAIFVCPEMMPDDVHGAEASAGVISFRGGMTSHAACCCRGMEKPCITGLQWHFGLGMRTVVAPHSAIREGDLLTIDGTEGIVYAGRADCETPKALQNDRLLLLFRLIDVLSAENELPHGQIGKTWRLRDVMLYGPSGRNVPDPDYQLEQWPVGAELPARAFNSLGPARSKQLYEELLLFRLNHDSKDHVEIWNGLRTCLLRLFSKNAGLGRHPAFWRPLFDPCRCVFDATEASGWSCKDGSRVQLVGEEFFSINHHVPELIDIATIRMYWAVECKSPSELWRLDRTNPGGEKLLRGSTNLMALKIIVNDATVSHDVLGVFYNALRRREYYWKWYTANNISRQQLTDGMRKREVSFPQRIRLVAHRAGLISERGSITRVGESLLRSSTASERAHSSVRIGW